MSPARAAAASVRANTTSKPDVVGQRRERGDVVGEGGRRQRPVPGPGSTNSAASAAASVADPPLPKVNSRPPAANRSAIAVAQAASCVASASTSAARNRPISSTFSCVERDDVRDHAAGSRSGVGSRNG